MTLGQPPVTEIGPVADADVVLAALAVRKGGAERQLVVVDEARRARASCRCRTARTTSSAGASARAAAWRADPRGRRRRGRRKSPSVPCIASVCARLAADCAGSVASSTQPVAGDRPRPHALGAEARRQRPEARPGGSGRGCPRGSSTARSARRGPRAPRRSAGRPAGRSPGSPSQSSRKVPQ